MPVVSPAQGPQDNIFQPQVEDGNGAHTLNKSRPPQASPDQGQVVLCATDILLERRQTAAVRGPGCQHTFLTESQP